MRIGPTEPYHHILVNGGTVVRDGRPVKITGDRTTHDIKVGCTTISRAALKRLLELADTFEDACNETVLQEGDS